MVTLTRAKGTSMCETTLVILAILANVFRPNQAYQAEDVESAAHHLVGMLSSVFFWIGSHVAATFTRISFIS